MKIKLRPAAKAAGSKSPTTATRNALADRGAAMPGGRYPAPNADYLQRGIRSLGRTPPEKRPAVVAFLRKRAKALGRTDLLKKGALAMSVEEYADMLELAGALADVGNTIPMRKGGKPKGKMASTQNAGGGNDKTGPISKATGGLKTTKGKMLYAKLCSKGLPKSMAIKAALKAEKGLKIDEMSNSPKA